MKKANQDSNLELYESSATAVLSEVWRWLKEMNGDAKAFTGAAAEERH